MIALETSKKACPRRRRGAALAAGLALLAFPCLAPRAGAIVLEIHGHRYGVMPIKGVKPAQLRALGRSSSPPAAAGAPETFDKVAQLGYHGGPVMHSVTTHVIYWDPGGEFTSTTKGIVHSFFADVAHDSGLGTNVWGVAGQYGDGSGHALYSSTFGSEETDTSAYPPKSEECKVPQGGDQGPPYARCMTDEQLQSELSAYVSNHKLARGPTQLYLLLLPHKVVTCLSEEEEVEPGVFEHVCSNNWFCAYHSWIGSGASQLIYADIPFSLLDSGNAKSCQADGSTKVQTPNSDTAGTNASTRFADVALKYTSHEYLEAATDPTGEGWFENKYPFQEIGDKCNIFGEGGEAGEDPNAFLPTLGGSASEKTLFNQSIDGGDFYLQSEWDNATKACLMRPAPLSGLKFSSSPATPAAGATVAFSGSASDPYGHPTLTWKFGDGSEATGLSPEHVYAAPASYEVMLSARDALTGSSTAPVTQTLDVGSSAQLAAGFSFELAAAEPGKPVKFKPSGSEDPGGSITGYRWSFGDGSESSEAEPDHAYVSPGSYAVTLTVTDSATQTASTTHTLLVENPRGGTGQATAVATGSPLSSLLAPPSAGAIAGLAAVSATFNPATGTITFREPLGSGGTLSWLLTFQNGRFGVFAASTGRCKPGFMRLRGRCRPARVVYGKGSRIVAVAGTLTFKVRPSPAARRALYNALRRGRGLPVSVTLTFRAALGGAPASRTKSIVVKLKRR